MRIARARIGNEEHFGHVTGSEKGLLFHVLNGDPLHAGLSIARTGQELPLENVQLLAPVAGPTKIVGFGKNFTGAPKVTSWREGSPVTFLKPPSAVIGPGETILLPSGAREVELEAELAVVIGTRTHRIQHSDALDHAFGYTVVNDVTAKDYMTDGHWTRPKGYDTFCPVGPWIETELDPRDVMVQGAVDGVIVQRGSTADMVLDVAGLIAYAADIFTLEPGDLILTGSPPGRTTLVAGQKVTVSVDGIGELINPVELAR
ncbi:fumarylacetoacetate hydrolase family protein [Arthrobacter sp. NPDC056493]|uniref:fumarylacetoacetate hydrolase family protein n=1 Tax=Arthrobacter sp. NPDC056493 TaxID=3345839 RepID=UPI003671257D